MNRPSWRGITRSIWACALAGLLVTAGVAEAADSAGAAVSADKITRQVTFKLTLANRDLVWLGDPGSPTTMASIKPAAQPLATDACVRTLTETNRLPARRYLREARIVAQGESRTVFAFTKLREKVIGAIDGQGRFAANDFYRQGRELLPSWPADPSQLRYDVQQNALYVDVELAGPQVTESLDFLPLQVHDSQGNAIAGQYSIVFRPAARNEGQASLALEFKTDTQTLTLATANVPSSLRRSEMQLGSFDNRSGAYLSEASYRAGSDVAVARAQAAEEQNVRGGGDAGGASFPEPSVTVTIAGEFSPEVRTSGATLLIAAQPASQDRPNIATPKVAASPIAIDGNFDDWRNVPGVDDPRGDLVPYLDYDPDVDLLEFKVANDDDHIYLYARVVGQVGRAHAPKGRGYFYAYMDVDRNAETGFLPTRDDDCYYGVDIGDDCEVQFEFVDSTFRKTFYGFCGLGGNENVLKQIVTLGKSQYGRLDDEGRERADYKAEYVYRNGRTEITEDLKLGTSDTIRLAVSPDGSEVEIVSALKGFLKNAQGQPTVRLGQSIDVAAGMECSGRSPGRDSRWAADSTPAIRGYTLKAVAK